MKPWFARGTIQIVRIQKFVFSSPQTINKSRMSLYQIAYAKRIMRARQAYKDNHENDHFYRKDYNELQELSRELVYMSRYNLRTEADVQEHLKKFDRSMLDNKLKCWEMEKYQEAKQYGIYEMPEKEEELQLTDLLECKGEHIEQRTYRNMIYEAEVAVMQKYVERTCYNASEYFAEAFVQYTREPAVLKKERP